MLESPAIQIERITDCLRNTYGLAITQITFLPIGMDQNAGVYRAVSADATPYFVKLRRGFDEISVRVLKLLSDHGVKQIIAPLETLSGQMWAHLDDYAVIIYPFVEGNDGYAVNMTDRHWVELGEAFKTIHSIHVPPDLAGRIARETFTARWREMVKGFQTHAESSVIADPIAAELAALLKARRGVIDDLVQRAERYAANLQARPLDFVLCHSDIHAGNVFIGADGALYIVDWDAPILAPKERDLMYAGGGQFIHWRTAEEEERLFYQGYGRTGVDPVALAYYRFERIIEDVAEFCRLIFDTDKGDADRREGLRLLQGQFETGNVIDVAYSQCKA